ncbi:hypothetical protein, partial [Bacillus mycoides]|uniref:hypothetical protein n=1 Tax=Bacillus mycoides TaxID=1405 RepID=UPI001C92CA04
MLKYSHACREIWFGIYCEGGLKGMRNIRINRVGWWCLLMKRESWDIIWEEGRWECLGRDWLIVGWVKCKRDG